MPRTPYRGYRSFLGLVQRSCALLYALYSGVPNIPCFLALLAFSQPHDDMLPQRKCPVLACLVPPQVHMHNRTAFPPALTSEKDCTVSLPKICPTRFMR